MSKVLWMYLAVEDQAFGDKLRIAREQHNLTRVQLAEQIGSSSKTVARWERGETLPRAQFLQKLCAILVTTPQELGLETKVVEKEQENVRIRQHNASPTAPATLSADEPEKRSNMHIFLFDPSYPQPHIVRGNLIAALKAMIPAKRNDQQMPIPDLNFPRFHIQIVGKTGCGKSSTINALLGINRQGNDYKPPMVQPANDLMFRALNISSPKDISPPEDVGDRALYGSLREKVIFLARADETSYIPYIAENLTFMYQYAFASNFYGMILPAIFTIHLQIDIGEVVTSMTNATQIIHQVLSDPAWQGFGVVISIFLPFIMGYKKKSSPVGAFLSSIALAA